jgi:tol-pal system protein YbgF
VNLRGYKSWLVVGVLLSSACRFPEPTRPENRGRDSSSSSSAKETSGKPEDLQTQVQQIRADHQSTIDDLDQKLRALQDKIDILEHNVQETQKQGEKINVDIDHRLTNLEKKTNESALATTASTSQITNSSAPASSEVSKSTTSTPPGIVGEKNIASPTEQQYQTILDIFMEEKNYDKSIKEFKKFIQNNPKDSLAGNAQYWIGEGYYAKADYPKAITEFQKVIDKYPTSTKKCDTLLKQGMAFANMKDSSNAKLFLKETVDQCSGTTAADKARKLL